MAYLNEEQSELSFRFRVLNKGPHVVLINYYTPQTEPKVRNYIDEYYYGPIYVISSTI